MQNHTQQKQQRQNQALVSTQPSVIRSYLEKEYIFECWKGTLSGSFDDGNECARCPAGQISKFGGQMKCTDCAPGHYTAGRGMSGCIPCLPGKSG